VEGYAIQLTDLADAELDEDKDVSAWLNGESGLEDAGVVTVEVPDASAHAWTEIYTPGFGWVPVDFTPPASDYDESEEYSSLMSLFRGLFSIAQGTGSSSDGSASGGTSTASSIGQNQFFLIPVGVLVLLMLLFVPVLRLAKKLRRERAIRAAYRAGNYDAVLPYYYQKVIGELNKKKEVQSLPALPSELFGCLRRWVPALEGETERASELFERGIYGSTQVAKEEMDFFADYTKQLLFALKKTKTLL
jgi:hypothetical protein